MNPPIAFQGALDKIKQLKNNFYFRRKTERVDLADSVGREFGETIHSNFMSPEFEIVDGYVMTDRDIKKSERVLIHLFS
jgi:molybdopterin biosynthesis enzyme